MVAVSKKDECRAGRFLFEYERPFLHIHLPSGRSLAYFKPRIENLETPWGEMRPTITYQTAKMGRQSTHPGKLTENIIQALARDVLAYGLQRVPLEVVGHVHDEIIALAGVDDSDALSKLENAMVAPPWCADAPIAVEGWEGSFYRKD